MQTSKSILVLAVLSAAITAAPCALAADATGTWYVGAGIGQSRAKLENSSISSVLTGTGATVAGTSKNETSFEGKAFVGYQFNKYIAAEGGFFRLGKFSFDTFSHKKSMFYKSFFPDLKLRYPPYEGKLSILKKLLG